MQNSSSLLLHLYLATSRKYVKFKHRLKRILKSGEFTRLTFRQRHTLLKKARKLHKKLQALSLQLKLGTAAASLSLVLSISEAEAQQTLGPFVYQTRSQNPFRPPLEGFRMIPTANDVDKDGDIDIVVGEGERLRYFENVGSRTKPAFEERTGIENPFAGIFISAGGLSPAFIDLNKNDSDTDLDLFIGDDSGEVHYFRNDNGVYTEVTGAGNPVDSFDAQDASRIASGDMDGDGDIDLLLGGKYGGNYLTMFENDGSGVFTSNNKFQFIGYFQNNPALADLDKDGDLDLFLGGSGNSGAFAINYYKQNASGNFQSSFGSWDGTLGNPFHSKAFDFHAAPLIVDLDNDGDFDGIIGQSYKYNTSQYAMHLAYLENKQIDAVAPSFLMESKSELENPFDGITGSKLQFSDRLSSPALFDVDGDNKLDLVLGSYFEQQVRYYKFEAGKGIHINQSSNPFPITSNDNLVARPVNLNNDDFADVFLGNDDGPVSLKANGDGTYTQTTDPITEALAGVANASIVLLDVDSDNDLDVFAGVNGGAGFKFLRNNNGTYVEETTTAPSPFNNSNELGSQQTSISTADINNDGTMDLVIGAADGSLRAYVNSGNNSFAELQDQQYPFNDITLSLDQYAAPFIVDYDKDGDNDVFVGDRKGVIHYLKNENPAPVTNINQDEAHINIGVAAQIFPDITISDDDNDYIRRAEILINDFSPGNEVLNVSALLPTGITHNFDEITGLMTITGIGTVAEYQTALRLITYQNNNGGLLSGKTVSLQVFDEDGTTPASTAVNLIEESVSAGDLIVYNAVSANGDGLNDYFFLQFIDPVNKVTIYNRWGDKVFEMRNYDNTVPGKRFEGNNDDGKSLPSGIYFYKIELPSTSTGSSRVVTGYLSLKN